MPPKRTRSRPRYIKKYRKRYTKVPRTKNLIMPDQFWTKLKTVHQFLVTSAAVTVQTVGIELNNMLAPIVGASGETPRGFAEMAALYDRYQCYGVKVKMTGENLSATSKTCYMSSVLVPQSVVPATTSIDNWAEHSKTGIKLISNDNPIVVHEQYINLPKETGVSKANYMGESLFGGLVTSGPANVHRMFFGFSDPVATHDLNFRGYLEVTQYCVFKERKRGF